MNRNDGAVGDARKRQAERDEFDIPERFAYLIAQAWDEGYRECAEASAWMRQAQPNPYREATR